MRFERLESIATREIGSTLESLPPVIREAAGDCIIELLEMEVFLRIDETIESDLLGLFEGNARSDPPPASLEEMPRIRLFLDNLWDESDHHWPTFREEVRITLLHELGHYLGLDEDQVAELGLA